MLAAPFIALAFSFPTLLLAQQPGFERLPGSVLDVRAPSARVTGNPGEMRIVDRACRSQPLQSVRERIVNIAVQEWAYFGFSVDDMTRYSRVNPRDRSGWRRRPRMTSEQASEVASSIAGYWAAAPYSSWILERQNVSWESRGIGSRWRNPWSAAFISWVMCEGGLGESPQFQRAIAHHSYIDQAIEARGGQEPESAYIAYDTGEMPIEPGDMLCRGSRPAYQSIEERRRQLGVGARTHCDIVVKLDDGNQEILVIGGNVRGSVRMKRLPASLDNSSHLYPVPYNGRRIFAHLKLKADPIPAGALESSPTLQALYCQGGSQQAPVSLATLALAPGIDCQ